MQLVQRSVKALLVSVALLSTTCLMAEEVKKMDTLDPAFQKAASYSLGARYAQAIKGDFGDMLDVSQLLEGFTDSMKGKELTVTPEELQANLLQLQQVRSNRLQQEQSVAADKNLTASNAFLEKNKTTDGIKSTETGLQYKVLKSGDGQKPAKSDKVSVHYHGTLVDGTVFDSSIDRGTPASFPVGGVIPGWTEALQLMSVGDKWVLYVPSDLAYGERGTPGGPIGPNQALIFEVELLSVDS